MSLRTGAPYALLAGVLLAVHASIALTVGAHGWDDGSITLAFARTLATDHRIAITPVSESVEGFSSPLWMLLLAVTYKLFAPGFFAFITLAQLWTATFATLTALLTYRLVVPWLGPTAAWVCCAALFAAAPFLDETMNGMEMSALAAVAVALAVLLEGGGNRFPGLVYLVAFLGPMVRLEAAAYLFGAAAAIVLLSHHVKLAVLIAGGVASSVLVLTLARLALFGSWLPNTVRAKQWTPYNRVAIDGPTMSSLEVAVHAVQLLGPVLVFGIVIRLLSPQRLEGRVALTRAEMRARTVAPVVSYSLGYVLGVMAFNLLIGENWGYLGRMELSAVALVLVLASAGVTCTRGMQVVVACAALVLMLGLSFSPNLQIANLRDAQLHRTSQESSGTTPARFRLTGLAVDRVRRALRRRTLEYMTPDVGGSSLCCPNLQVRDSALLANATLAETGYSEFGTYLRDTAPDIIETHAPWSRLSGIQNLSFFARRYRPIVARRNLFYLRSDDLQRLRSDCTYVPVERASSLRAGASSSDLAFLREHFPHGLCALRMG